MFLLKQGTLELHCNDELQYEIVDKYLVNGVRTSKKKIQYVEFCICYFYLMIGCFICLMI